MVKTTQNLERSDDEFFGWKKSHKNAKTFKNKNLKKKF